MAVTRPLHARHTPDTRPLQETREELADRTAELGEAKKAGWLDGAGQAAEERQTLNSAASQLQQAIVCSVSHEYAVCNVAVVAGERPDVERYKTITRPVHDRHVKRRLRCRRLPRPRRTFSLPSGRYTTVTRPLQEIAQAKADLQSAPAELQELRNTLQQLRAAGATSGAAGGSTTGDGARISPAGVTAKAALRGQGKTGYRLDTCLPIDRETAGGAGVAAGAAVAGAAGAAGGARGRVTILEEEIGDATNWLALKVVTVPLQHRYSTVTGPQARPQGRRPACNGHVTSL